MVIYRQNKVIRFCVVTTQKRMDWNVHKIREIKSVYMIENLIFNFNFFTWCFKMPEQKRYSLWRSGAKSYTKEDTLNRLSRMIKVLVQFS